MSSSKRPAGRIPNGSWPGRAYRGNLASQAVERVFQTCPRDSSTIGRMASSGLQRRVEEWQCVVAPWPNPRHAESAGDYVAVFDGREA